jgi:creatinine amidohydrolase/Fe(II)-dependent formamide hydrolase-like protein
MVGEGYAMRFADLTFEEIRRRADEGCLAIVPTGCTEQQGPHLSVDFDTWFAQTLLEAAAERAGERFGNGFATSISLFLRPQNVRQDCIAASGSRPVDWDDPDLDFGRYSSSGVTGDLSRATAELGEQLWEASVEAAVDAIRAASRAS